jgi:hypothetical protein
LDRYQTERLRTCSRYVGSAGGSRWSEALLGLQQPMNHQQLAHQLVQGLAGGLPVRIADRLDQQRVRLALLLRGHPPGVRHPCSPDRLALRRCQVVARVVADDLDHHDGTEGGPQPAEGRELVIVDLGHATMMPDAAC